MGDGIAGPVTGVLSHDAFEILVTHFRKDNAEEYGRSEKIIMSGDGGPRPGGAAREGLEAALRGRFVSCSVRYRDPKTDALVCDVFVQNPPEGF